MDNFDSPCKIFVAGPRAVSKLNADVQTRLYSAISKGHTFLVGDANGADKAIQSYLAANRYKNAIVYSSGGITRNNLGDWPVKSIEVAKGVRGFDFYAAKDMAMVRDADYGLMIWNGKSKGTLNDLINLIDVGKTSLLYFIPHKKFYRISQRQHVERILGLCAPETYTVYMDLSKQPKQPKSEQTSLFQ